MQEQGIDPVVSKIEIEYHTPLHLAETMTSCLWLERRGPRFLFHQEIFAPSGALAAKALVTVVALENGRISRGDSIAPLLEV
jgi:acyl-CoA thioester hydrolase